MCTFYVYVNVYLYVYVYVYVSYNCININQGCEKMAKIITFGLQKGGVSKTTTTGITSFLLSKNYKVLAVDMDSQGNLTELLANQSANNFLNHSVFEAIAHKEPKKYIYKINSNLDLLPSNNFLANYAKWLYTYELPHTEKGIISAPFKGDGSIQLKKTLDIIKSNYDFILIDTPPALSEQTTSSLLASDYVVVLYEASKFCYSAIPNFMETVNYVQSLTELKILGILRTLSDGRRKDVHFFNRMIENDYPKLVFDTIISRRASIGRIPLNSFKDNPELESALTQFKVFYSELIERLKEIDN